MKRILHLMFISLFAGITYAADTQPADTSFIYRGKQINLTDSIDQVKVKIYDTKAHGENSQYKQVFEGIYTDGKSYEKWTVLENIGFQFPLLHKKRHREFFSMEPHWVGFGFGLSYATDNFPNLSGINGFPLKAEESHEFFWNFSEIIIPIYRNHLGITAGCGFDWRNYHLDNNTHLVETNGFVSAEAAPAGIRYEYSRLRTVFLTFPLLLEWQPFQSLPNEIPFLGRNYKPYLSVGVVGGIKTLSSSKVKYDDLSGHSQKRVEEKGLNVVPITIDYMVLAGVRNFGFYAKYSPYNIFQHNKGPAGKAVSIGITLGL